MELNMPGHAVIEKYTYKYNKKTLCNKDNTVMPQYYAKVVSFCHVSTKSGIGLGFCTTLQENDSQKAPWSVWTAATSGTDSVPCTVAGHTHTSSQ